MADRSVLRGKNPEEQFAYVASDVFSIVSPYIFHTHAQKVFSRISAALRRAQEASADVAARLEASETAQGQERQMRAEEARRYVWTLRELQALMKARMERELESAQRRKSLKRKLGEETSRSAQLERRLADAEDELTRLRNDFESEKSTLEEWWRSTLEQAVLQAQKDERLKARGKVQATTIKRLRSLSSEVADLKGRMRSLQKENSTLMETIRTRSGPLPAEGGARTSSFRQRAETELSRLSVVASAAAAEQERDPPTAVENFPGYRGPALLDMVSGLSEQGANFADRIKRSISERASGLGLPRWHSGRRLYSEEDDDDIGKGWYHGQGGGGGGGSGGGSGGGDGGGSVDVGGVVDDDLSSSLPPPGPSLRQRRRQELLPRAATGTERKHEGRAPTIIDEGEKPLLGGDQEEVDFPPTGAPAAPALVAAPITAAAATMDTRALFVGKEGIRRGENSSGMRRGLGSFECLSSRRLAVDSDGAGAAAAGAGGDAASRRRVSVGDHPAHDSRLAFTEGAEHHLKSIGPTRGVATLKTSSRWQHHRRSLGGGGGGGSGGGIGAGSNAPSLRALLTSGEFYPDPAGDDEIDDAPKNKSDRYHHRGTSGSSRGSGSGSGRVRDRPSAPAKDDADFQDEREDKSSRLGLDGGRAGENGAATAAAVVAARRVRRFSSPPSMLLRPASSSFSGGTNRAVEPRDRNGDGSRGRTVGLEAGEDGCVAGKFSGTEECDGYSRRAEEEEEEEEGEGVGEGYVNMEAATPQESDGGVRGSGARPSGTGAGVVAGTISTGRGGGGGGRGGEGADAAAVDIASREGGQEAAHLVDGAGDEEGEKGGEGEEEGLNININATRTTYPEDVVLLSQKSRRRHRHHDHHARPLDTGTAALSFLDLPALGPGNRSIGGGGPGGAVGGAVGMAPDHREGMPLKLAARPPLAQEIGSSVLFSTSLDGSFGGDHNNNSNNAGTGGDARKLLKDLFPSTDNRGAENALVEAATDTALPAAAAAAAAAATSIATATGTKAALERADTGDSCLALDDLLREMAVLSAEARVGEGDNAGGGLVVAAAPRRVKS